MLKLHSSALLAIVLAVSINTMDMKDADAQLDISASVGAWVPFLPDYNAGSIVNEGVANVVRSNVFNDSQTDVGMQYGLHSLYHFAGTRTMFESEWTFARIDGMAGSDRIGDPDPLPAAGGGQTVWLASLDGLAQRSTADGGLARFALDSDVTHYSRFVGLRDRFDMNWIGLGDMTIGCGFSYMRFEQNMNLDVLFASGNTGSVL